MAFRIGAVAFAACCFSNAFAQGPNPLEPSGFPVNTPKDLRLPPPLRQQGAVYEFKLIESETWEAHGSEVKGDKVTFEFRGYRVYADEALGDVDTEQFALRGNVNVLGEDYVVRGDTVFVDFRARTFRVMGGEADLRSTLAQGRLLGDVYVRAATIRGSEDVVEAERASVTTCDYDHPHYTLETARLTTFPYEKMVFRDLRLRVLDKTIIRIPRFVIPLERTSRPAVPEVGSSPTEGAFARLRFGVPIGGETLLGQLNLTANQGVGLGLNYNLVRERHNGELRAFTAFQNSIGRLDFSASGKYSGNFGWAMLEASNEYRQYSYLVGPGNVTNITKIRFAPRQAGNAQTSLTYSLNTNQSSGFTSNNSILGFSDVRKWTPRYSSNVQLNLTTARAFASGMAISEREALDTRIQTSFDLTRAVAEIDYQRSIPIGSTFNFFSGIDRTPELTIRTDAQRLFAGARNLRLPNFTALFAAGNYHDNFLNKNVGRYFFDVRTSGRASPTKALSFVYDAGIRQGVYSDGTAQYTPNVNAWLRYERGNFITANFRYNYSRQHGFSPLSFDRTGQFNVASADVMAEIVRGLRVGGQAGFDFYRQDQGQIGWISPSLRMEYQPNEWFRLRGLANYLPQNNTWGNIRFDLSWKAGATYIGFASRYDAVRHTWGNANLYLDALKWGRLKFTTLLLYNGYLERFDSRHFSFTYDLHCAEAVLQVLENNTGFRPGRQIIFFIRIKALPFDSPFGTGTFGQPLGIGTGRDW